jgi:hypothetical protein
MILIIIIYKSRDKGKARDKKARQGTKQVKARQVKARNKARQGAREGLVR